MKEKYEDIDLELEEIVFLCNAEEGNPGIYELTWELAYYDLTIEDKYKIARELVSRFLSNGLVILEKYTDSTLRHKLADIPYGQVEEILNNPYYWYPCNEIIAITLTIKGKEYLDKQLPKFQERLKKRWIEKNK